MRKTRIVIQLLVFVTFVSAFFFLNRNPTAYSWQSEALLYANPFTGLLVTIASRSFFLPLVITAASVIILTVVFGRFFCGFFCPLGSIIDFMDRFLFAKMRSAGRRVPGYFRRIKYVIMIALLVLSLFGSIFPLIVDPLTLTTRFLTAIVNPIINISGVDFIKISGLAVPSMGAKIASAYSPVVPVYYGVVLTGGLMLLVLCGGFWGKRFWCGYICPTGAFLAVLSRYSIFRRKVVTDKCSSCSRCAKACPTEAIDVKNISKTNISECIECGVCTGLKESCSRFVIGGADNKNSVTGPDLQKRHLITGAAGGLLLLPVFRATAISKRDDHGRLIRPPGALPEEKFLSRCTGCGECMKVCPTNALQPCMFTDGFSRLYTPKVVPRVGGCEEKCSLCGNVCPNGAIRKLPLEEKSFVKIGTAVVDRHRCLAWAQNRECLVCDEVCPYNAIESKIVETTKGRFKVPVVYEDLCAGCGLCEQHCPIFDIAAIVVYRFGENRRESGEYVSRWQKEAILERRRRSDSANFEEEPAAEDESGESGSSFSDGFLE